MFAGVGFRVGFFFFPECNNKNREIYTKSNIYSPQIYFCVIAKLDYTTTSYL